MSDTPAPVAVLSYGEAIGDALYKIPFARALRGAFPDRRIVWITTNRTMYAGVLKPIMAGLIDEIHDSSGFGAHPSQLLRPLPPFARGRFSAVIDTQSVVWRALLARRLRHEVFVSPAARFLLSERRPPPGYRKPRHMVDRLLDLLELASGKRPVIERGIELPADLQAAAATLLPPGPTYVALAPGAGKRIKCWPLERFAETGRIMAERGRVPVYILGPDELEWLPMLRETVPGALFPEQERAVWGDRFTPLRTMAIVRRCAAALANDSGVSHMFGAADIPLLTLFGPTDAEKFRPKVTRGSVLTAQQFGGEAMDAIPVAPVVDALETLIGPAR